MDNNYITKLREDIINFINNGGNIYQTKKTPFCERVRYLKRTLEKENGRTYSYEEIYAFLGIHFDRTKYEEMSEFDRFKAFCQKLEKYIDQDGYVDEIRSSYVKDNDNVYEILKNYADKYKCAPIDFLILMTGCNFKKAYIQIDYVAFLQRELKKAYPNGDLKGIKYERPDLYEGIRHLRKYLPEHLSMEEVADFLGVYNLRFESKVTDCKIKTDELVNQILEEFPDRNVTKIMQVNKKLYYKAVELSRFEDKTPAQWFNDHRFIYKNQINMPRLSKVLIDTQKRAELLNALKLQLLQGYNLAQLSELETYKANLEVLSIIVSLLEKEDFGNDTIEKIILENDELNKINNLG